MPRFLAALLLLPGAGPLQDGEERPPEALERRVGDDPKQTYFLLGAEPARKGERKNLLLVLPGGTGQAKDFLPFLGRLHAAVGERYVFAALSSPQWNPEQAENLVWPTERSKGRVPEAKFSTESFVRGVFEAIRKDRSFDLGRTFVFGWSSSGPAVYAASADKDAPYDGYYILGSVFRREDLKLNAVKGRKYYLQAGTQDTITPVHWAETAEKALSKNGAKVKLAIYEGGHGFGQPDPFGAVRAALAWLE